MPPVARSSTAPAPPPSSPLPHHSYANEQSSPLLAASQPSILPDASSGPDGAPAGGWAPVGYPGQHAQGGYASEVHGALIGAYGGLQPSAPLGGASAWAGGASSDAHTASSRPTPLCFQPSQESVTTADPCSPGRHNLQLKLRMGFAEAYPPSEAEEDHEAATTEGGMADELEYSNFSCEY